MPLSSGSTAGAILVPLVATQLFFANRISFAESGSIHPHRGVFVGQPLIFSSYSRSMSATVTVIVRVKPV